MMFFSHGFCVASHYSIHKSRCGKLDVSVGGFAIVPCGHSSPNILVFFFQSSKVDYLTFIEICFHDLDIAKCRWVSIRSE